MAKKSLCKSGKILRLVRQAHLMSQSEMAFKIDLTPGYLALIEKGVNTLPPGLIIPIMELAKEVNFEIDINEILNNYYEEYKEKNCIKKKNIAKKRKAIKDKNCGGE